MPPERRRRGKAPLPLIIVPTGLSGIFMRARTARWRGARRKFAPPDRPVIAMVDDGAMQMNNMEELITIAKYHQHWPNQTFVVMVLSNEDLNQVTWAQRVMLGDAKVEMTQRIPNVPYHFFAQSIGLEGIFVDDPEQVGPAWERALNASWRSRPTPRYRRCRRTSPSIRKAFMSSAWKAGSDEAGMIKGAAKQVLSSVLAKD